MPTGHPSVRILNVKLDLECAQILTKFQDELGPRSTTSAATRMLLKLGAANRQTLDLVWRHSTWEEGVRLGEIEVRKQMEQSLYKAIQTALSSDPTLR